MIISGHIYWAKILGNPQTTKFNPQGEWSFDFVPDDKGKKTLLDRGMNKEYFKTKENDDKGEFLQFKRNAVKKDQSPGKPYTVVDSQNNPWDQTEMIGNGSKVNLKVALNEAMYQGKKRLKPSVVSIQVWDHVPYTGGGFPTKDVEDVTNGEEW